MVLCTLHVEADLVLGQFRFAAAVLGRWLIGRRFPGLWLSEGKAVDSSAALAPAPNKQAKGEAAKGSRRHGLDRVELWSRSPYTVGTKGRRGVGCGMSGAGESRAPEGLGSWRHVVLLPCHNNNIHTTLVASSDFLPYDCIPFSAALLIHRVHQLLGSCNDSQAIRLAWARQPINTC